VGFPPRPRPLACGRNVSFCSRAERGFVLSSFDKTLGMTPLVRSAAGVHLGAGHARVPRRGLWRIAALSIVGLVQSADRTEHFDLKGTCQVTRAQNRLAHSSLER
jgi:hypothetical protein